MNFAQICYGKPNNRWEAFNVGGSYTNEMVEFFTRNSANNAGQDVSAEYLRHEKFLWEITSCEKFTEVSKVKYGIIDGSGRTAIFSHGFVFNNEERCLENPSELLSINDSNFKFTFKETKNIPEYLIKETTLNIQQAIDMSGISESSLLNVICAAYISLNSLSNYPVYFVYNGDLKQIKALAFLLYSFLPYSLRYKVSVSNTNNLRLSASKCFMFVNDYPQNEYYYNILTGETNIDLEEAKNNKAIIPFLSAINRYSLFNFDLYCRKLDNTREKLGYPYVCEYEDLLNVNTILSYLDGKEKGLNKYTDLSDLELTKFLLEFISKAPFTNLLVDEFIAELLVEYKNRKLVPNELLMEKIKFRNTKTKVESYKTVYKQLQMVVLVKSGEEATIDFLNEERNRDLTDFNEWVEYIINSGGNKYIDNFFDIKIRNSKDLKSVLNLWDEVKALNNNTVLAYSVKKRLQEIALKNMMESQNTSSTFHNIFMEYSDIYINAFGNEPMDLIPKLVDLYWPEYDINNFEFSQTYFNKINELVDYKMPTELKALYHLYETVIISSSKDDELSRDNLINNLNLLKKINLQQSLKNKICKFIVREFEEQQHTHIFFWYQVAKYNVGQKNLPKSISCLIEWDIAVFMSNKLFFNSLQEENITKDFIEEFILIIEGERIHQGFLDIVPTKSEEYYLAKERLGQLKKQLKMLYKEEKKAKKHFAQDEYEDIDSDNKYYSDDSDDFDGSNDSGETNKKKFKWFKR